MAERIQVPAELLRLLVDRVPSMLAYWDRDLRCHFANQAYRRWFGVDPAALVGTTLPELLGPELFARNEPHVRRALAGEEQHFERIVPGPDGIQRHSLASYLPDIADGEVQGFVAMVHDVSELKRTQEKLVQAQEGLAVTLASIDAGFIATDRQGLVSAMNAAAEQLTGWSAQEAIGQPLWSVFDREDRPPELKALNPIDVMQARGIMADEAHHVVAVSRQGRRTPVEVKAALTYGPDGGIRGIAMVMRDRSRQIQADIDASRLAAIVESSHDAIISKRLDGTIQSWNAAAEHLFGYTAEEAIGRSITMLIPEDRHDEELRVVAELARGSRVRPFETLRRRKDGQFVPVSLTISPIRDADGRIVGASKIARDISDRLVAEEARARAQHLEAENRQILEATRMKSQFLANMSHELRTPLNAIIGFAELIQSGRVASDPHKLERFVGHIATSGRHLLQLINDVLDLSKVEAGRFEFFPERLDLSRVVREVCDIVQVSAERKGIALVARVDPSLDDIQLDPVRLKQVLYNYLSNAIKFTPDGGRVSIRALPEGPAHWRLEVEDTGIGIGPAHMRLLFTTFQQIDAGYSKQHQGTGLGLALTKRLVEAQGGTVGVESVPGQGSVFHAVFRRVHAADGAGPHEAGALPFSSAGGHLLVVEHDHEVRLRIMNGLAGAGFQVSAATNGAQAAAMAGQSEFDALTLGLRLPDQGGLGLLADLRSRAPGPSSPVIGLTAAGGSGRVASFAIADILAKPIRADEVMAAMTGLRGVDAGLRRVMVIDDELAAREVMHATLAAAGLEAVCFAHGRDALAALDALDPDAIVLDLMMPGMNGFEVLDALQQMPRGRRIPVYIWTSMLLTDDEYHLLADSAREIVSKGGGAVLDMLERLRHWRPTQRVWAADR